MFLSMLLYPVVMTSGLANSGSEKFLIQRTPYGGWAMRDGLPAFVYTADQSAMPSAAEPPNAAFGQQQHYDSTARGNREHSSMIGNDRITLVGSNYGSWRIRQDEGGPKWLTDSDVDDDSSWRFGGGISYVFDGETAQQLATTAFTPGAPTEREWGVGYGSTRSGGVQREARGDAVSVVHTVAVLPGDSPTVHIEVTLTNHEADPRNVTLAEVWNTGMVHMVTGHGWGGWSRWNSTWNSSLFSNSTARRLFDRRAFVASHYNSSFQRFANASGVGAVQRRNFTGFTDEERLFYAQTSALPKRPALVHGSNHREASLWDTEPPAVFLTAVQGLDDGGFTPTADNTKFVNNARSFYGHGGGKRTSRRVSPSGLQNSKWDAIVTEGESGLIAVVQTPIPPHGQVTLTFMTGYVPQGASLDHIVREATLSRRHSSTSSGDSSGNGPASLAASARAAWEPWLVKTSVASEPWVSRELLWHSFILQATPTVDTYFNESMIDQGTAYRYNAGFQGAIRDPLQHALPLIHSRPDLVRSILRYSLKEQMQHVTQAPGSRLNPVEFPDSVIGSGVIRPSTPRPDDFELYLLHLAVEYVSATKDRHFLSETVNYYDGDDDGHSVLHGLCVAANFTMDVVGVGPHGLLRLLSSDWDDGFKPPPNAEPVAESVLTSALAAYVLPRFGALLRSLPQQSGTLLRAAQRAEAFGESLRVTLWQEAWNGRWLRRAWLGPNVKWVGTKPEEAPENGTQVTLYSAQVGWALLADVFRDQPTAEATQVAELLAQCRNQSGPNHWPLGFGYRCNNSADPRPGSGAWPAVNHVTLMGLASRNYTAAAWSEFTRNSLDFQSKTFPEHWLGQWTMADTVDGAGSWNHSGMPGNWTWSFPALCTHAHAWPLVSFGWLAGLHFTPSGLDVAPRIPPSLGAYTFHSALASIQYDGHVQFTGRYSPALVSTLALEDLEVRFDFSYVAQKWSVQRTEIVAGCIEFAVLIGG
jgi:hypothetical protein